MSDEASTRDGPDGRDGPDRRDDRDGPREGAADPAAPARRGERPPRLFTRLGLAIAHPRWALAIAADRRSAGRSGSDLIVAILLTLAATELRGLATAVWLGGSIDLGLGLRAAMHVLTGELTVDLGLLVLGALAVYALAGPRRNLGRAFDLACVAALPLLFVDLAATVAVRTAGLAVPTAVGWLLSGVSYAWMGGLITLAIQPARRSPARVPAPPAEVLTPARRIGWGLAAIAVLGVAVQAIWIADNLELVRPMKTGDEAPGIALPQIEANGKLGPVFTLAATRGKVTVIDFWATWCGPCLASMPRLEKLAREHPDVAVLAINLDDPAGARALFDQRGYTMKLLADDGDVNQRYGVTSIPHTVIVDRHGVIRQVVRGTGSDIAAAVEAIRASD
ncbi:MAG TPA: TlpA disulfide reductase family protein [Kofleriaceae bacterium]|nr:TlpA disulfide reductase family protein [Kofleriaceae bacterium]